MNALPCLKCKAPMQWIPRPGRGYHACIACQSRFVPAATLRKLGIGKLVDDLWQTSPQAKPARACPYCRLSMHTVVHGKNLEIDICRNCVAFWCDPNELESLKQTIRADIPIQNPPPLKVDTTSLPTNLHDAHQALGKAILEEWNNSPLSMTEELPDEKYKIALTLLGLPVEVSNRAQAIPYLNWSIVFLTCWFSIASFSHLETAVADFGFIPSLAWRHGGLTWITSFFLHGSWFHLLGNMYFLWIFGDDVEEFLGRWKYFGLLLTGTLGANLLVLIAKSGANIPHIGASGGVSAILAFYAVKFARHRLYIFFFFRFYEIAAGAWILMFLGLSLIGSFNELFGLSRVSHIAHLGGALVGIAAAVFSPRFRGTMNR